VRSDRLAEGPLDPDAPVFPTSNGKRFGGRTSANRILAVAVRDANEQVRKAGDAPLPEKLTRHSMRGTFASVLYALRRTPARSWTRWATQTPDWLRVYRQAMRRGEDEREGS
jgi:hypothetical protein